MLFRLAAIPLLLFMLVAQPAAAGGNPKNKASITFHLETAATDNPKMIFPHAIGGKTRYFTRSADFILKDVATIDPRPDDSGLGYGIVIRLKPSAAQRLSAITNVNQGRWLVSSVNGRIVDGVLIDKQIDDGVLVIWQGLTLEDIALIEKALPRPKAPK